MVTVRLRRATGFPESGALDSYVQLRCLDTPFSRRLYSLDPSQSSSPDSGMRDKHILLCVTGGIAAFKAILLLRLLTKAGAQVRVLMTESATRFVGALTFEALSSHPVLMDLWETGGEGGESHIRLAEWADLIVVVPATANTLARLAHGLADDLIGATLLAACSPVLVAPAMHTRMYQHPATLANLRTLRERGVQVLEPVTGDLASGFGMGRLAEPEEIFEALLELLTHHDLQGVALLVAAGPTLEPLDPIRHLTNHSTGKMGYAVARMARRRGARVTLVSGPTQITPPGGITVVPVETAQQMHDAVMKAYPDAHAIIMSAAVADYTPRTCAPEKMKKSGTGMTLELDPTIDILAALGRRRGEDRVSGRRGPALFGFAMETEALEQHAAAKLERKGCDLIVANNIRDKGAGFGHDTNQVTLLDRNGGVDRLPLLSKEEVASRILDRLIDWLPPSDGRIDP